MRRQEYDLKGKLFETTMFAKIWRITAVSNGFPFPISMLDVESSMFEVQHSGIGVFSNLLL